MKLSYLLIGGFLTVILVSIALTALISFSNAQQILESDIDPDKPFSLINDLRRNILLIGVLMVAFGFASSLSLYYAIANPLKKLTVAVNEVSKGNFDIEIKKTGAIDEINDLGQSLNRILASMKLAVLRTGVSKEEIGLGEAVKARKASETAPKEKIRKKR